MKRKPVVNISVEKESAAQGFQFSFHPALIPWLENNNISFAFTTYQIGKLFVVGKEAQESRLSLYQRTFPQPMGLASSSNSEQLIMGALDGIWHFFNEGPTVEEGIDYDRTYRPRLKYQTGECDAHDLGVDKNGDITFVNTKLSCLTKINKEHFIHIWKPPFVSALVAEDRCHLNGLAFREGEPRYITAFSQTDTREGWREHRQSGGFVMDIQSNEILCHGLSMPHSPRWYRDKLWLLNSGEGNFGYVEIETKKFTPVAFCPGYARGLSFYGDFALIGLSEPRRNEAFSGLNLNKKLSDKRLPAVAALQLVDLTTLQTTLVFGMDRRIGEIYDVSIIPHTRIPCLGGRKERHNMVLFNQCVSNYSGFQERIEGKVRADQLNFRASPGLLKWMQGKKLSFALSLQLLYNLDKLILLGVAPEGRFSIIMRDFLRSNRVAISKDSRKLYLFDGMRIQYFKNNFAPRQTYQGYDAFFIPKRDRNAKDIVDMKVEQGGDFLFSSSANSIHTFSRYSEEIFTYWGLDELKEKNNLEELRITGFAMCETSLQYVTAMAKTEGVVIDMQTDLIIARGLSYPSSPCWHQNKLWLLNGESERRVLGYIIPRTGRFHPVLSYPGQDAIGLYFYGNVAIFGMTEAYQRVSVLFVDTGSKPVVIKHWLQLSGAKMTLASLDLFRGINRPYLFDIRDLSQAREEEQFIPVKVDLKSLPRDPIKEEEEDWLTDSEIMIDDLSLEDDISLENDNLYGSAENAVPSVSKYSASLFIFWQKKEPILLILLGMSIMANILFISTFLRYGEEEMNLSSGASPIYSILKRG